MKVFRVQRLSDGDGPYSMFYPDGVRGGWYDHRWTNEFAWEIANAHTFNKRTPAPQADGLPSIFDLCDWRHWNEKKVVFGFESEQAAGAWFDGWGTRLWEEYHNLAEWEVDEKYVVKGRKQLVFNSEHGRLIASRDIREVVL